MYVEVPILIKCRPYHAVLLQFCKNLKKAAAAAAAAVDDDDDDDDDELFLWYG